MQSFIRLMIFGLLGAFAYLLVNGYQANDVIDTMSSATEQAQEFVSDIDIEGETVFESIDIEPARQISGTFDYLGPTSTLAVESADEE